MVKNGSLCNDRATSCSDSMGLAALSRQDNQMVQVITTLTVNSPRACLKTSCKDGLFLHIAQEKSTVNQTLETS